MNVWVLETYGGADLDGFGIESLGLNAYYDYIDERTSGMEHDSEEFEWGEDFYAGLKRYSCYCYGEFVARLHEVKIKNG